MSRERSRRGPRTTPGAWLLAAAWLGFAGPVAAADPPSALPCRLPAELPVAEDIPDPVFAVLLGLMEADACGILTQGRLEREVRSMDRPSRIPVDYLHVLRRSPREDGPAADVSLFSIADLDLPIPYRVLGYHPGRMRASKELVLEEWRLGTLRLGGEGNAPPIVLEEVRLWGLRRGGVEIDIDGWLDRMMGEKLDDMRVGGFVLMRYRGERIGLALGYSREGIGRSGAFDFRGDRVLFPSPPPLKRASAVLRSRLERLMPSVAELRKSPP